MQTVAVSSLAVTYAETSQVPINAQTGHVGTGQRPRLIAIFSGR